MLTYALALGLAWAQDPAVPQLDADLLTPSIDAAALLAVEETTRGDRAKGIARLVVGYAHDPLVVESDDSDAESFALLRSLFTASVIGGYDFGPARVAVEVPFLYGSGDFSSGGGLGDLRFDARGRLLDRARFPVGLGVSAAITAPTSTVKDLPVRSRGVSWQALLLLDGRVGRALLSGNFGVRGGPPRTLENVTWATQIVMRGGAAIDLSRVVTLSGEILSAFDVAQGVKLDSSPVELLLGGTFHTQRGVGVRLGAGAGLTPGVGAPVARALLSVDYERPGDHASDRDKDGLADDVDQCPDEAEDMDGFEDGDGCPDATVRVAVRFVDPSGADVPDVTSSLDGTAGDGGAEAWQVHPGSHDLVAAAAGFEPLRETLLVPEDGMPGAVRTLQPVLGAGQGTVTVRVKREDGSPIAATWSSEGRSGALASGEGTLTLPEGRRFVDVSATGYGGARLALDVTRNSAEVIELTLLPPRVAVRRDEVDLDGTVYFETNTAVLQAASFPLLDELALSITQHPELLKLRIEGHTDSRGSTTYNQQLSEARAKSVCDYLIAHGVEASRLDWLGLGESRPIDPRESEVAWSVNRRVEVRILDRQ